jgi:hypothetical protein
MATLDLVLLILFGTLAIGGLAGSVLCFRKALTVAARKDGDVKMFLWTLGTLFSLIVAGLSTAYILLPIILH